MTEKGLLNKIQLAANHAFRLFRNNTGRGWIGKCSFKNGNVFIENARPLNAGLTKGGSDLIGWASIEITPEMVGRKIAVFVAFEAKTGKQTAKKDQANFIKQVQLNGGIAGVVRSSDDPEKILNEWKVQMT